MTAEFFLNNIQIDYPGNFEDLNIELNYDKDSPDARVTLDKWRFVQSQATIIQNHIDAGLTGGVGIFEGIPFRLRLSEGGTTIDFDFFLDLTDGAELSCDDSTLVAKERQNIDWFNTNVDSFTFEFLARSQAIILPTDYKFMPYVISAIPDNKEIMIATIGLIVINNAITEAIQRVTGYAAASINPFQAPGEIIKLVLFVIYFITVLVTLIKLIDDLITMLIQPVKFHGGMYAKTLFERGCSYLGLDFQSTIFDDADFKDLFVLPAKFSNPRIENDRLFGFLAPNLNEQRGYPSGTFGDFVREMKTLFNAKIVIQNGTLIFERVDFEITSNAFQLPDLDRPFYTTNANELDSTVIIEYLTDVNDKNTIDEYSGTIAQISTIPINVDNRDALSMRGVKNVNINYAQGKRKTELTSVENIIKVLLVPISLIINIFVVVVNGARPIVNFVSGAIQTVQSVLALVGITPNIVIPSLPLLSFVNLGSILNNRIGMLKLENDIINVPKLFIMREGSTARNNKIDVDNADIMSAENIYNEFHSVNSFVERSSVPLNQWIRRDWDKVPFSFNDFLLLRDNARVTTAAGNDAKIESVKWNIAKCQAEIQFRERSQYTNNLKEEIFVPDGR